MEYSCQLFHFQEDYDGEVIATLLKAIHPVPSSKAVLYIHGYNDYFFQDHMPREFIDRGYNFYALDLRKCGRSLLEGQHPNYCPSMKEYYPEMTGSIRKMISDGSEHITLLGHSAGGLLCALYAGDGEMREYLSDLVLSPFFEFNTSLF